MTSRPLVPNSPLNPNPPKGPVGPATGAPTLADILAFIGKSGAMSDYEKAQIDATNRGLDIRQGELGQRSSSDAAGNAVAWASQQATQSWYEAQAANQRGDLALAQKKQEDANYWNGVAQSFSSQSAARDEAQTASGMFGQQETSRNNRATNEINAGNIYGNLASTVGNLAAKQQELGLDILTKPRNAVAGFLMGMGDTPAARALGANLDIKSILGIDPQSIQQYLQMAMGAAQQAQAKANAPAQIDLGAFLSGLDARAKQISAGAGATGRAAPGAPVDYSPANGNMLQRPGTPSFVTGGPSTGTPAGSGVGANSTAPDFTRTPQGTMTVPGNSMNAVLPGSYDPYAAFMDGQGGAPVSVTSQQGYPVATWNGGQTSVPYAASQQPAGDPMLDQLNALLFNGGDAGYNQPQVLGRGFWDMRPSTQTDVTIGDIGSAPLDAVQWLYNQTPAAKRAEFYARGGQ